MNDNHLVVGTKVYYTGDMANASGHFEVLSRSSLGSFVTLRELPGGDGRMFTGVYTSQIGSKYEGHCNPRFVTEEARQAFYAARKR